MEVAPFFVDFHHFLSIFTIFYRFSRFTHFCRGLHFVAIYALFPQFFFGQNSLLRNISRFLHVGTAAGCGGCDKYELWWSHFKQRQELSAASQGNRTKTSSSEDGGALGQPPRCGHLCHRLLGRGHVQCHVSWHRDRGDVKDAAIFPLNINYIICNIYIWLILRCSRKLSLVEGRFSKWFQSVKKGALILFLSISMAYNWFMPKSCCKHSNFENR